MVRSALSVGRSAQGGFCPIPARLSTFDAKAARASPPVGRNGTGLANIPELQAGTENGGHKNIGLLRGHRAPRGDCVTLAVADTPPLELEAFGTFGAR
ncbi:hypothetical protein CHN51_07555 [Sphingorhabdus sp. YGSMI21]|nr:hypothetical protein CHN51_07555 [Sphingorhabdus sp. YGSMI21]